MPPPPFQGKNSQSFSQGIAFFARRKSGLQTDGPMDRQTDRQANGQACKQPDRQTDGWARASSQAGRWFVPAEAAAPPAALAALADAPALAAALAAAPPAAAAEADAPEAAAAAAAPAAAMDEHQALINCCSSRCASRSAQCRKKLVLFGMQNRTLGPYLVAINRIPIS
jgi:hypothetical protein